MTFWSRLRGVGCAYFTPLRFAVRLNGGRVILTFSCPALCASVIRFVAAITCVARVLPLLLLGQVDSRENCSRLRLVTMEVSSPMRDGIHGLDGALFDMSLLLRF